VEGRPRNIPEIPGDRKETMDSEIPEIPEFPEKKIERGETEIKWVGGLPEMGKIKKLYVLRF
jgi:hypothetical protein